MAKAHKYGAKAIVIDGIKFASTKEGRRYQELKLLEKIGAVSGLELQPKFALKVNGTRVANYVADFQYCLHGPSGLVTQVVEDVKGMKTRIYSLKRKMVEAQYGIKVTEI